MILNYLKKNVLPIVLLFTIQTQAQNLDFYDFGENWYLNANAGYASFYGDLGVHDDNIGKKFQEESDMAYGLIFGKEINPLFGIRGQFLTGSLKGAKESASLYFNTDFISNSLQFTFNPMSLVIPNNNQRFALYVFGGFGLTDFWAVARDMQTDAIVHTEGYTENGESKGTATTEAHIPMGFGMALNTSSGFYFNFEFAGVPMNSDKLDALEGNTEMIDIYTYISFGVGIKFVERTKHKEYKYKKKYGDFSFSRKKWLKRRANFSSRKKGPVNTLALKKK